MARPIIYLAFANNKEEPFLDLNREDEAIYNSFVSMKGHQDFQIHRDQFTSAQELIKYLSDFKNLVSIFHFGGHASEASLYLSDQEGRDEGLAILLAQQKHLKCVFLNGCHTAGFIKELLNHGIPAVIATDRAVDDTLAVQFAERFYNALTQGESIREAFVLARGAVQVTDDRDIEFRGEGGSEVVSDEEGCPWGVYSKDEQALDWTIARAQTDVRNLPGKFWLRFAILLLAIFAIFTWSNWHIGTSSTTFFLANGPLALIGISAFLVKQFGNLSPGLSSVGKRISWFFLKTPVLIIFGLLVTALGIMGSSVKVDHQEGNPLSMHLTDQKGNPVSSWLLDGNSSYSRMLALAVPFSEKKKLYVDGYHPINIDLKPLVGNRLQVDDLLVRSSLLIRLNANEIGMADRVRIVIDRPPKPQIVINPMAKPSVLLGSGKAIPESITKEWEAYLIDKRAPKEIVDIFLKTWADTNHVEKEVAFAPGEKLLVSMFVMDSLILNKQVIIKNQALNDVLLEK